MKEKQILDDFDLLSQKPPYEQYRERQLQYESVTRADINKVLGRDEETRRRKREELKAYNRRQLKPRLANAWFLWKLSVKTLLSALIPSKFKVDPFQAVADRENDIKTRSLVEATIQSAKMFRNMPKDDGMLRAQKKGHLNPALSPLWAEAPYAVTENPYQTGEKIENMVETRPPKKVDIEEKEE